MTSSTFPTRRDLLTSAGALAAVAAVAPAAPPAPENKVYRIGVISASIDGQPQKTNGHTWHFAQYFHPEVNQAAVKKYLDPGSTRIFEKYLRNPRYSFDQLPFPDTRITHVYSKPADGLDHYIETFPGVKIAKSLEELVESVDAVWMGDASGKGNDHYDLVAPAIKKGLPTFCDKPIGGTVAGTKAILDLAKKHGTPLMSSSLFRHEFGMEQALRHARLRRLRPSAIRPGELGRRLQSGQLVHLRPASDLDGRDAVRRRRRGGEHVRPPGDGPCACHLQGSDAGRGVVRPTRRRRTVLPHIGLLHEAGVSVHAGHRGRFLVRPSL